MRLFLAVPSPRRCGRPCCTAQADLRRQGRGSFPPPENLHLTLAFLGETSDLDGARAALAGVSCRPFSLAVGGPLGHFDDLWWAGVRADRRPGGPGPVPPVATSGPGASAWRTAPSGPTSPWSAAGGAKPRR